MTLPDSQLNRRDLVLCAAVLLCALALLILLCRTAGDTGEVAVVMRGGEVLARLPLNRDTVYTVTGEYENVIRVENGTVRIEESSCPGGDCVHQGAVSRTGSSLVCLPNRVTVTVQGDGGTDVVIG